MSAPPKTKPPPHKESDGESDEGSETSDEGTEDEEQAEGGSDFESESDKSTDTTKKKLTSILPSRQQSAVKASASVAPAGGAGSPAKRIREVNGKKEKEDEPLSKKKRLEVATPAAKSAALKPMAPLSDKKKESAAKVRSLTAAKEKSSKDSTADKDTKKSIKKKLQSSAAKSDASRPSKSNTSEGETPQKTAKPSRPWLPDEELALSKEIQKDRVHDVYGAQLPAARADPYWEKLIRRLSFMDKYENEYRVERLCEKVRRMRLRYDSLLTRIKAGETNVWKNDHEGKLWRIWHTIWGPNKATPDMLNGDGDEEEEDEFEEEDEESEEEDEEDDVEPTQVKGRQLSSAGASAQKKALSRKKAQSSSDDDDSPKEETPVMATLPAVLAAPAVPSAEGKQPLASKSIPANDPASKAMEMETSQRVVVDNGAHGTSAVASVRNAVLSDELRAENLSFLRDMRGTCVKLVEEAKTQSLLISERILEEICAKTSQIVEDATEKSSQIMEELRMVLQRLGAIAGQNERMNSSGINYSENLFQVSTGGSVLRWGNGVMGDQSQLEGRWREQSEAEQGLLLQRLQLVQEQARVQQEGIRLNLTKLNLQKQQQAKAQDKA